MATRPVYPLLTAEQFLEIDFGDLKAELDNGVIRMMAGGTQRHARVQSNLIVALAPRLRGTGCAAYGPDMATRTRDMSIRYPDVSVFCGRESAEHDDDTVAPDPRILFEILSDGTARTDLGIKLAEYRALPSVDTIVFVDIAIERLRVIQRTGPNGWNDTAHSLPLDLPLPALRLTIAHDEIFARD